MVATIGAPSHYEWQSHVYSATFREKSDEELGTIVSKSERYLEGTKGFTRFFDILIGTWDDQQARKDVAQSLLEERTQPV